MDDESSDILGQQTKPVLRGSKNAASPGMSLTVKLVSGFAILLGLYVVVMRIWFRILLWKERSHKLAMRRRHGIPDNDHRPFNVAYAAVLRARQERDVAQKPKATQSDPQNDRRNTQTEQNVRQRLGSHGTVEDPRAKSYSAQLPGAFLAEGTPARSQPESSVPPVTIGSGRAQHAIGPRRHDSGTPLYLTGYRRSSRRGLGLDDWSGGQKRGIVEDPWDEQEAVKKSKRESGLIGDDVDGADEVLQQRGAKRYFFDEDNEDDFAERQTRDKRPRKVSLEKGIRTEGKDLDMDIDEDDDEVDDLPYIQRGKKRDRAEAGSTFGADDEDSGIELDGPGFKPKGRTRKRRTFSKRKSEAGVTTRGQKRDRDAEDQETDQEDGDDSPYVNRKKRGKKATPLEDDLSENSTTRSLDSSSSRNRKIGEEWTCNGIRWKIGPNRQRLRQALVKKARQRFPMPQDSQHPDREVDFEVYVECWLNEDEYRDAKQRHVLAGQDSPKRSDNKLTLDVQTQVNGKNLLWSSTTTPVDSPISRSPASERALGANQRISRTSFGSSGGTRTNPLDQALTQNMRRISSISRTVSAGHLGSPSLADSTNASPYTRYKTYSKLEKQELEAAALMKLRELKSKKEVGLNQTNDDQAAKQKENVESTKAETPGFAIPTITVSTPSETAKQAAHPSPLASSNLAEDSARPAEAPKVASFVPFPSGESAQVSEPPKPSFVPGTSAPTHPSAQSSEFAGKPSAPTTAPPSLFFPLSTSSPSASSTTTLSQPAQATFGVTRTTIGAPNQTVKAPASSFPGTVAVPNTITGPSAPQDTTKSPFSFGFTSQPGEQKSSDTASTSKSAGSFLSSRLGPAPSTTSTTTPANPSQPTSFFNLAKPAHNATANTTNTTHNIFSANSSQPVTQTASSDTSTNPGSQIKFDFKFAGPANTSSAAGSNTSVGTNANLTLTTASTPNVGNPFAGMGKGPDRPMVNFTPLTPDGGTKGFRGSTSNTTQLGPELNSFGFRPLTSSANGGTSISGPTGGTSNLFGNTVPSKPTSVFGTTTTTFGAKPTENKPAESSSSPQTTKPLFNFGVSSGSSPSVPSNNTNATQGAANSTTKPSPTSLSHFGALGSHASGFGPTSSAPADIFGSNNTGPSNSSAHTNGFGVTSTSAGSSPNPPSIFGAQTLSSSSGNQTTNVFGNAGTNGLFNTTNVKSSEASKSVFGVTPTPATNGSISTTPATEHPKPTFKFQMPASASVNAPAATTSSSGPQFTFKFDPTGRGTGSSTNPTTSGTQSAFATQPSTFGVNTAFGSTGGSSAFNPLGMAPQTNASQK